MFATESMSSIYFSLIETLPSSQDWDARKKSTNYTKYEVKQMKHM